MKPHIKLERKGVWSCSGNSITRNGVSPRQAYDRCHTTVGTTVQAAATPVFTLPPPRVATPMTVRPDRIEARMVGAATLGYSESMVRQVTGTAPMRPWVPPKALRINQARAAAHQPPMMFISSRAGDMFHLPEEALAVAFTITELPIEPKNATQLIIEALRERYGLQIRRLPSCLTPHDWHAQAVLVLEFTKRTLAARPDLWRAVLAEYSPRVNGAKAIQKVTDSLMTGLTAEERLLADAWIMRQFRGKPALEEIAARFPVSRRTVSRRERWWREQIAPMRREAIDNLAVPMLRAGLLYSGEVVA